MPAAEQGATQIRLISVQLSMLQLRRELDEAEVMEMIKILAKMTHERVQKDGFCNLAKIKTEGATFSIPGSCKERINKMCFTSTQN